MDKNVLLITVDCFRKDYITPEITPTIYKLKQKGLDFEKVITHSSHTTIALQAMFGSTFNQLPKKTLPGILNEYGYFTACITSQPHLYRWNLKKIREDFQYVNLLNPHSQNILEGMSSTRFAQIIKRYDKFYKIGQKLKLMVFKTVTKLHRIKQEGIKPRWSDAKKTNRIIYNLVKENKIKEPYFLWVHYIDPHSPYAPPKDNMNNNIDEKEVKKLNNLLSEPFNIKNEDFQKIRELYSSEVRYVDSKISELLSFIEEKGLMDNTITVVSADHREEFFEHGGTRHSVQLYDEVVNVPFIVHGHEKKGKIEGQRGHINLAPTILDLLDLPEEESFQGKSMFEGSDKEIVMKTVKGKLGIRTEQWKYISTNELYDINNDPEESTNKAQEHPELIKRFEEKLESYGKGKFKDEDKEIGKKEDEFVKERLRELGYLD